MSLRAISDLVRRPPFSTLFAIDGQVVAAITENMRTNGFDPSQPIAVWQRVVIDGHTRLAAAEALGLDAVPVFAHTFPDEAAALEYAIARQRDRRNLSDAELLRCVAALDERKAEGRPLKTTSREVVFSGRSAGQTAALLGVSRATVERARVVIDHADEPTKQAVLNGTTSVNKAAHETQVRRHYQADVVKELYLPPQWFALPVARRELILREAPLESPAHFNRTNDNVEWALWTWNPVTGCDHGCPYCYARVIAERFYTELPAGQRFTPVFRPDRLHAPRHMRVPVAARRNVGEKNVFVCSMADLFGKWVPQDWIDAVFTEVVLAPQWNFLFLTKFPQRLAEQQWPANAWCGTTVDTQARVATAERAFDKVQAGVKWLSCEPLLERLTFDSLSMFDWVVIGGQSAQPSAGVPEIQPPWEWVEHLIRQARAAGCQVYLKPNLTTRPREYPQGVAPAETPAEEGA